MSIRTIRNTMTAALLATAAFGATEASAFGYHGGHGFGGHGFGGGHHRHVYGGYRSRPVRAYAYRVYRPRVLVGYYAPCYRKTYVNVFGELASRRVCD